MIKGLVQFKIKNSKFRIIVYCGAFAPQYYNRSQSDTLILNS